MLRLATVSDLYSVKDLCYRCWEEMPSTPGSIDYEKALDTITYYLTPKTEHIVLLAEDKGKPFGLLVAFASPVFFGLEYESYELIWYVLPEYRKHRDAIRLHKAYEAWAVKIGCDHVCSSEVHGWPSLEKYYLRNGYVKSQTSYRKSINHGH